MLPIGDIIRKHGISFHCYADDTKLYIYSKPNETYQLTKCNKSVADIKKWMTSNFLLNSKKQRFLLLDKKLPHVTA